MREMKDSGIEWIGEIPIDWSLVKIKHLPDSSIVNNYVDGDWIESPDITDEGIRYLTTGNIGDGNYKNQGNGFVAIETFKKLNCKYAYPGDLIISRLNSPYGRSCILPNDYPEYVLAVDNVILRPKGNKKYICYLTQCDGYQNAVLDEAKGTTMKRISRTNLGNIVLPYPSLKVQERIADYLDSKCAEIDSIIEKQEAIIEKLKEYKLSVITEAVTKGLNPDAEMKVSGIDICDVIPEHWNVLQNRYLFSLRDEKNYLSIEEVQLLSLYTDLGVFPHGEQEERGNKAVKTEGYKVVYQDDIVVNIILAWMGAIGRSAYEGVTSPAYDIYKPAKGVCSRFYHYLYRTKAFSAECYKYGRGIMEMRWRTYSSEFKSIKVPVPPIEEQIEIADYLDKKCDFLDKTISDRLNVIKKIQEYKKSLIYEVVTGKREV